MKTAKQYGIPIPVAALHRKCMMGEACNGPGCKVSNGKTKKDRYNKGSDK